LSRIHRGRLRHTNNTLFLNILVKRFLQIVTRTLGCVESSCALGKRTNSHQKPYSLHGLTEPPPPRRYLICRLLLSFSFTLNYSEFSPRLTLTLSLSLFPTKNWRPLNQSRRRAASRNPCFFREKRMSSRSLSLYYYAGIRRLYNKIYICI